MKRNLSFVFVFLIILVLISTDSFAITKPLANLKDYNGTYNGAPGTGTIGYTNGTLYRDNYDQGAVSGCNGEGCGKHPGVDIPITSGTSVYAAISGTVVRSECNGSGWGGLIVVQATSPYTGETIYITYAHLRSWNYSVGQTVSEGVIIGQSGGGAGDYCQGNSTGSHLHFQIDKNDGNNEPWYPSPASNVNQPDTTFEVTGKTFNPIVFVTGKYNWTFDQDGFYEYWTTVNIASSSVSSGILQVDGNLDPYIWRNGTVSCGLATPCSAQIAAEAALYKYVAINLQNYCVSNPAKIYFKTSASDTWDEAKSVSFNYTGPGTYSIYMGGNSYWTGIIKNIRIDPAVNCNPNASDPEQFSFIRIQN